MGRLREEYKKDNYKNFLMKQDKEQLAEEILELEKEVSILKGAHATKGNWYKICQV